MDTSLPKICTAPFSSVLIDINKNIKPCNQYAEGPLRNSKKEYIRDEFIPGNLKQSTLRDVLNNDRYTKLKKDMHEGVIPRGCEWCLQREKETGFSQRQAFMPPGAETYSTNKNTSYNGRLYYEDWHKGITVLELDTSNICNLTCAGCDSFFSSMWKPIEDNGKYPYLATGSLFKCNCKLTGQDIEEIKDSIRSLRSRGLATFEMKI